MRNSPRMGDDLMEGKLDFLDDEHTTAIETEAPEPQVEAPVDVKGETEAAPPAVVEQEKPSAIPISALLDERDRRQKAEREAEELRQYKARIEAQQKAQPAPDFYADPDQRLAYERQQFQQQFTAMKLQQSRFLAERDFGADTVNEAYAYFDQNPQLSHQFLAHPSPFHAAVEFYKRQRAVDEIGADPDAWKAKQMDSIKEQLRAEIMAELQGSVQPKPRIPGSLASAPAAGKAGEPRSRGSAYDAAFGG